jgi:leucyl-tRNA synthetase
MVDCRDRVFKRRPAGLGDEKVKTHLGGKQVAKVVVIPDKPVNVVVR